MALTSRYGNVAASIPNGEHGASLLARTLCGWRVGCRNRFRLSLVELAGLGYRVPHLRHHPGLGKRGGHYKRVLLAALVLG